MPSSVKHRAEEIRAQGPHRHRHGLARHRPMSRRRLRASTSGEMRLRLLDLGAWVSGPLSATTIPSLISMTRRACCATSLVVRDQKYRVTLRRQIAAAAPSPPRRCWLSSAPVGSSARMICPPFISARAIDTRCCWPPDKLVRPMVQPVAQAQPRQQLRRARASLLRRRTRHRSPALRRSRSRSTSRSDCSSGR